MVRDESGRATQQVRLTSLAHGGGCGCKLAPAVLQELLANQPAAAAFPQLLVGTETADDAAIWKLDGDTCVIATTDFFMPVVDDPVDFGRIAATNAISDIYAMGGKPILALAILGMPLGKISTEIVREILRGGAEICARAGNSERMAIQIQVRIKIFTHNNRLDNCVIGEIAVCGFAKSGR